MRKCETIFVRDPKTFLVTDQVLKSCEWVSNGEGIATRKWDGTCCLFKNGNLYKRYDGSKGKYLPTDFIPAEGAESHFLGWRPVGIGPEDRWHIEAFAALGTPLPDGTYELIGPKVNKNPEQVGFHVFKRHGDIVFHDVPRDFVGLRYWLEGKDIEGVVFHNQDGRMAKIKLKDFGLQRTLRVLAAE